MISLRMSWRLFVPTCLKLFLPKSLQNRFYSKSVIMLQKWFRVDTLQTALTSLTALDRLNVTLIAVNKKVVSLICGRQVSFNPNKMYPLSSQKKYWTFNSIEQLGELRLKQNQTFIEKHGTQMEEQQRVDFYLDATEERLLLKQYEMYLNDFCRRFEPTMPKCVVGTAFHYFKRFFLHNSPMDYHPKEILATCVYLACKTEEFNVSIGQFVSNIKGDRNKAMDIILSNELLLMQHLNYYLTIHNPYRPIEGFLIDIKTRSSMVNPERLRPHIDSFIEKTFFTDACLLYAPSQIALAAVLHAAGREQENLDSYVTDNLLNGAREKLPALIEAIRKIRIMVKQYEVPLRDRVKLIEKKLEKCRNQENNPDSEVYKERMRKMYCDDELEVVEDASYHLADSSADMSALNMSQ